MILIVGMMKDMKGRQKMVMLRKKTNRFWKISLTEKNKKPLRLIMISIIALMLAGCSDKTPRMSDIEITTVDKKDFDDIENIEAIYGDICDKTENTSDSLEEIRSIVNQLGRNGYAAVDSENQIDMVCAEQIKQFCRQVKAQEEAEETLVVVISESSFIRYAFTTKDGNVKVKYSYCRYEGDYWETAGTNTYPAYTWVYSDEGYLFFEEYHMPGFDGPSGHTAVRVEPLDETCRELNRKYLRTIGYELNNLFTSDWSEDDFLELNFYDIYEVLYQIKNKRYPASFLKEGQNYEIPSSEFESVFQTFFRIDAQVLQQYTIYHEDTRTYQYRTRGMFDFAPTPYIPYPEVISYEENPDGTVKLMVNAVWAEKSLEKAFFHEVIIRPLDNGGFQYVSNHVIPSENNVEITWYRERLTDEQWQEYYGEMQ